MLSSADEIGRPQTMHTGRPPRGEAITDMIVSTRGVISQQVRHPGGAPRDFFVNRPLVPVAFRAVNSFYVAGGVLAAWALVLTFLGLTRENFPATPGAERTVGLISVVLVLAAIGAGIYSAATDEEEGEEGEEAALVLPL